MHLDGDADKRWREPELHSLHVTSGFPDEWLLPSSSGNGASELPIVYLFILFNQAEINVKVF